jgi:hypothetical protein
MIDQSPTGTSAERRSLGRRHHEALIRQELRRLASGNSGGSYRVTPAATAKRLAQRLDTTRREATMYSCDPPGEVAAGV